MFLRRTLRQGRPWLLLAPCLLLFLLIYVVPVARMLALGFNAPDWGLQQYVALLQDPASLHIFLSTAELAVEVTILCVLIGYPIAYAMLVSPARVRTVITALVVLPVWISVLVRSYAWIVILGRRGIANQILLYLNLVDAPLPLLYNRLSVYVGLVHILLPFVVLPVFSVMQGIDLNSVRAARSLGASKLSAFLWVFLPLSLPGVISGSLLVFISTLGIFIIPALLGGLGDITFVMLIEKQVDELLNWPAASAMAGLLLAATLLFVILYQRLFSAESRFEVGGAGSSVPWILRIFSTGLALSARLGRILFGERPGQAASGRRRTSVNVAGAGMYVFVAGVLGFLLLPLLILFPLAFSASPYLQFPPSDFSLRWFRVYFGRNDWIAPTIVSFEVATITMVLATPLGTLGAIALARYRFPGKALIEGFLLSPLMVPSMIIALGVYRQFSSLQLVGTITGLVLSHLIIAIPFVVSTVTAALRTTDDSYERAARSLGANAVSAFLRVTAPLIRPAILTGAFFAFLASFDDLVIALFMSGTAAKTLPKRIWEAIREEVDPTTAAVAALLVAFSLVLLLFAELAKNRARRRRITSA